MEVLIRDCSKCREKILPNLDETKLDECEYTKTVHIFSFFLVLELNEIENQKDVETMNKTKNILNSTRLKTDTKMNLKVRAKLLQMSCWDASRTKW